MPSKAATVEQYLAELPDDRRAAIQAVREIILDNLDEGYAEGMSYGMIGYGVPHGVYPPGYHCDPKQPLPFAGLASQKGAMSLYLMCLYNDPERLDWFRTAWAKTGKKLDMGKSCIRFKKIEDLALDVIAETIRRTPAREYIALYEASIRPMNKRADAAAKGSSTRKATTKKTRPTKPRS